MSKRNYHNLSNLFELNNYNVKVYKDIDNIINVKGMLKKFFLK